jgi:hypothetical protein
MLFVAVACSAHGEDTALERPSWAAAPSSSVIFSELQRLWRVMTGVFAKDRLPYFQSSLCSSAVCSHSTHGFAGLSVIFRQLLIAALLS